MRQLIFITLVCLGRAARVRATHRLRWGRSAGQSKLFAGSVARIQRRRRSDHHQTPQRRLYHVVFEHLGKGVKARNAQISEWGSGAEQCAIRSVIIPVNTDNIAVDVQCISNTTGANVDARYWLLVTVVP